MAYFEFITDRQIYKKVIQDLVPTAQSFVWIGTADMKDMYVDKRGESVPFLEILSDLVTKRIAVRLLYAKEPGPIFRADFDRYENLFDGLERMRCPRVHFKMIIVDGHTAFVGSANLTGAGMGAKSNFKRNFESGFILSDDKQLLSQIMNQFDGVWRGEHCSMCQRKEFCEEYSEMESDV